MTTQEYDTDPSTPGAKRLSEPRIEALEAPLEPISQEAEGSSTEDAPDVPVRSTRRMRPTTDPGIAPPPQPLPVPGEPMGIVVPSVAPRTASDSVDALLEGIRRERSEQVGTPQTDGQTAASYHSEHALRAAQAAEKVEPKVLIERPVLAQTLRIRVSPSGAILRDSDSLQSADTTAVNSPSIIGRMALAVAAGVVVVILIFATLQRISALSSSAPAGNPAPSPDPAAASMVAPAGLTARPAAQPTPSPSAVEPVITAKTSADTDSPAPIAAGSSTTRKSAPASKPKPKAKPASSARSAADDLGEFKSAF